MRLLRERERRGGMRERVHGQKAYSHHSHAGEIHCVQRSTIIYLYSEKGHENWQKVQEGQKKKQEYITKTFYDFLNDQYRTYTAQQMFQKLKIMLPLIFRQIFLHCFYGLLHLHLKRDEENV